MPDKYPAEENVALARLRLFLSPHASGSEGNHIETSGDSNNHNSSFHLEKINSGALSTTNVHSVDNDDNQGIGWKIPTEGSSYSEFTMAAIRPLSASTKDYLRVSYLLQASLPGYKVEDHVLIWDMRNPSMSSQYEQHTSGFLELDSWVAINEFGEENCMQDVYSGGFQMPRNGQGMKFTSGNIILHHPEKTGQQQYVLCKVAVGRSKVITSETETLELPHGYNSFYLHRPSTANDGESESVNNNMATDAKAYYHEYIINDPMQILPQYLVQFKYTKIESLQDSLSCCALCEKNQARVNCKSCEADLCHACDTEVHNANKLVNRHKRVTLNNPVEPDDKDSKGGRGGAALSMDSTCRKHKDLLVEFYCPTCCIPVCVHCKMVGDHSCGEAVSHRLVSILDAYQLALNESQKTDPLIESRSEVIKEKLRMIENRVSEIKENSAAVEKAIYKALQDALQTLQDETEGKLGILLGEELELRRQVQQIHWAEQFLSLQRKKLGPVDFLDAWQNHKVLRLELRDFPVMHLTCAEKVKADIQLVGRVQVIAGETLPIAGEKTVTNVVTLQNDGDIRRKLLGTKTLQGRTEVDDASKLMSIESSEIIEKVRKELQSGKGAKTVRGFYWSQDKKDLAATSSSERNLALGSISPRNGLPFTSTLRESKMSNDMNPRATQNTINDVWTKQLIFCRD